MPSSRPPELSAVGPRVSVRTVREDDVQPYQRAVRASAERMRRWNPVNLDDLPRHIAKQSADHRTFFVIANEPEGDHPMVGRVNLNGVVRGRASSVAMGYDAYDPYVGRGLFAEGLRLVVTLALRSADDGGMGLHRVEANVQPGNTRSAGLLRSLGFRHEGSSPRLLLLPDDEGQELWRDHERFAITREEWPAPAYRLTDPGRVVLLFDTLGTAVGVEAARGIAGELGLPVFAAELGHSIDLAGLLSGCPRGAVVMGEWDRPEFGRIRDEVLAVEPVASTSSAAGLQEPLRRAELVRRALQVRADAHGQGPSRTA